MHLTLYEKCFDRSIWGHEEKIDILEKSISEINARAGLFLSKISEDFPELTDHSINHSLMLWRYAELLIGDTQDALLNPLEAYILHVAFLTHDAGTGLSVLEKPSIIETEPLYRDYIATYGDDEYTRRGALFYTIREKHAEYALQIATQKLSDGDYLIQNESLREEFGHIIGRIAESHAKNVNFIETDITNKYIGPKFPSHWVVRCRRLAYLLRVSDAAHLDNIRTPKSYEAIKSLQSPSLEHWTFQKKLGVPTRTSDRFLVYSANSPFTLSEQKAWWYCHGALSTLDREIKSANEYFEENGLPPLAVKGVMDINDPLSLSKEGLKTQDWYAIDTRVRVNNPVHIASELGGIRLYGEECIALRELLQNSIDAVNAYRAKTDQYDNNVGQIKVSITQEQDEFYLTVTDNGIGMSSSIMTNELLDFGTSYWKSNQFRLDHQGLASSQFDAIGKFGIGFFSVFMLGNSVTVTSWRHGDARTDMRTLDFYDGLSSTPVLRDSTEAEKKTVIDRGTAVRVRLSLDPYSSTGFIGKKSLTNVSLNALIRFLVPSADVTIFVTEADGTNATIDPLYLETQNLQGFCDYLSLTGNKGNHWPIDVIRNMGLELIEVSDKGRSWGKLLLIPPIGNVFYGGLGIAISKGIRVCPINSFLGFTRHDEIITVKRDAPSKVIPFEVMRDWGKKQKQAIIDRNLQVFFDTAYLGLLFSLDLYEPETPLLIYKNKSSYQYVTVGELERVLESTSELKVYVANNGFGSLPINIDEGYLFIHFGLNFHEFLLESDAPKIKGASQIIEDLCKKQWSSVRHYSESFFNPEVHAVPYFPNPSSVTIFQRVQTPPTNTNVEPLN